jgi:2-polyprenyl-3-methyl-5-hydroxy-6-metoxy-1,4-benzoquinol methylase
MNAGSEVDRRFAFGDNWRTYLDTVGEGRIALAEASLRELIGYERLDGLRFLDIGSGSGLFSLADRRLGARVHSFDYDGQSVAATAMLKAQYLPDDPGWTVERGSILDAAFLHNLRLFDVIYSWGVLHHTGAMMLAMRNA